MKNILLIEDDEFLRHLASKKLSESGFMAFPASSAEEGIKIASSQKPDAILLDLLLPGTDGFEALRRIKSDEKLKDIPVLVFSNLSEEKDVKMCRDLGVREYIVKSSCTLGELIEKLKETLS